WSLSMARTGAPHSATSQFFVNLKDNPALDPTGPNTGYAVFAHVVEGFDTIERMTQVTPGRSFGSAGGYYPEEPIVIISARRV
ncbi:MAG TPA: peptidylprolyl isomerase, partial [Candidatus Thermoplasmatota archaeon]|nr:peptidylprolyl isomerase [Candidatus Thermoplasmatota archaeon]